MFVRAEFVTGLLAFWHLENFEVGATFFLDNFWAPGLRYDNEHQLGFDIVMDSLPV
jgi:hypothetical protein